MSVQVLQPKFRVEETLEVLKEVMDKKWTGMGFKTVEFEEQWKKYSKFANAHFVNSGTSALHLSLAVFKEQYNWDSSTEVLTTPLTFVSTNHVILYESLKPVFVDVDDTLCMDPLKVKQRITNNTKALIYVGLGGNTGNYLEIKKICEDHNIKLILDAAHLAGTHVREMSPEGSGFSHWHIGINADASCFSFQAVKNLPTADSGMVCFRDSTHDALARKLSWMGIDKDTFSRTLPDGSYKWKYNVPHVGFKYNGNSIMAAMAMVSLKYLDEDNKYRNTIANYYNEELGDYNLHVGNLELIKVPWQCHTNSRHLYQILVPRERRDFIIDDMYDNGYYPGVHYITNTKYPMYEKGAYNTPKATEYSDRLITLPIHCNMSLEDANKVVQLVRRFI